MSSRPTGRSLSQNHQPGKVLRELTVVPSVHFHTPHPPTRRPSSQMCRSPRDGTRKESINFQPLKGNLKDEGVDISLKAFISSYLC